MRNQKKRTVLKKQVYSLADVNARVPQGSTLKILLLLIYLNNLADGLLNAKLFADATSLFSVVHNVNTSAGEVNNDSVKINKCTYQWKMSLKVNPIKQAQ